jgi:lipopolysaccharide assembly outer membrane protein LptD (OstA)
MKRLALISCVAVLAFAQTPIHHGNWLIEADQADQNGPARHLIGHVTMESDALILRADDVDYNGDTGEIVAHGDVHLKLK